MAKWKVTCTAHCCGDETYEATSAKAALKKAHDVFDHDRVPHNARSSFRVKRIPDTTSVTQVRDEHINWETREVTLGPLRDK